MFACWNRLKTASTILSSLTRMLWKLSKLFLRNRIQHPARGQLILSKAKEQVRSFCCMVSYSDYLKSGSNYL